MLPEVEITLQGKLGFDAMQTVDLKSWAEFPDAIAKVRADYGRGKGVRNRFCQEDGS